MMAAVMLDTPIWPPVASTSKQPASCLPLSRTFSATKAHLVPATSKSQVHGSIHDHADHAAPVLAPGAPARRGLDGSQLAALTLYLKSKRSNVKLRISDIAGTLSESGEAAPPSVRKGKIPALSATTGVQCCLIGRLPFERCEVVAMVVKKTVLYNTRKEYLLSTDKGKGKDTELSGGQGYVESDERGRLYVNKTEVGKIFYDLDDESGTVIACQVNPSKVYSKQNIAHQVALKNSEKSSASIAEESEATTLQPKFDPRLWIYRYKEPPRPAAKALSKSEQLSKAFEPPIYAEGTLVRAICRIATNYKTGERMLEAITMEAIDVQAQGGREQYAEWHHAREAMRLKRDVYSNKGEVAKILNAQPSGAIGEIQVAAASQVVCDATASQECNSSGMSQSDDSTGITSSLMDATAFNVSASISASMSSSTIAARSGKSGKLPSLRRIAEQKIPVSRNLFYLYVKEHFRKQHRITSTVLPGVTSDAPGQILGKGKESLRALTMDDLKADKALDWLATKCAKLEAATEAGLSSRTSAKMTKIEASIISSSPVSCRTTSNSDKPKLRADYVDAKKGKLFSWAVQQLFKDGVIFVHPPASLADWSASVEDPLSTPRALKRRRECLCSKDGNAKTQKASCECRPSASKIAVVAAKEAYSMITPESLLPALEPIVVRLSVASAPHPVQPDMALAALKRKDEVFMHVSREKVEEAMEML